MKILSDAFAPSFIDIEVQGSTGEAADLFSKLMPAEVAKVASSRSPQQPIVFLTQDGYGVSHMSRLFLEYGPEWDQGLPMSFENGPDLGEAIADHIEVGWRADVDRNGRNLSWDADFIPSNVVMTFKAMSPQHAYLRVVTALSDFIVDDEERHLKWAFKREPMPDGLDGADREQFLNSQNIDIETPMLFLHLEDSPEHPLRRVYWALVKMKDVVAEAQAFSMHDLA